MEIIADDRERAIHAHLRTYTDKANIKFKIDRINVGDYAIVFNDKIIAIIERKTWADLSASIKDGRKSNIEKLKSLREETGCMILYLIEGHANYWSNKLIQGIPYKNLRAHLDHLMIRDNVHVMHTDNEEYTADRLVMFAKNYCTIKRGDTVQDVAIVEQDSKEAQDDKDAQDNKESPINIYDIILGMGETKEEAKQDESDQRNKPSAEISGAAELLKKSRHMEININEKLFKCFRGIGPVIATLLVENGITLYSIYSGQTTTDNISRLKYNTGNAIGIDKAQKIINIKNTFNESKNKALNDRRQNTIIRLFECFRGISKKSAKYIIKNVQIKDILDKKISAEQLAEIQKGEKAKIGPKLAKQIINVLTG